MDKYKRFEDFMVSVVKTADARSKELYNLSLNDLYKVKYKKIQAAILALINSGWWVFLAVTALLLLGPVGFTIALASFFSHPAGWIALAVLGTSGGVTVIRTMYQNKKLPLAIRDTGNHYKDIFKSYQTYSGSELHNRVHRLEKEASDYLIEKALIEEDMS